MHTHQQIYQWNNTKMGKNTAFHIHVKSKHEYSPKYPEHVITVIGINMPRQGLDHKLREITKCDDSVAICDSQFVTVQNTTLQIDVNYARRYTPKGRKDVHINIGPYPEGFLCTSIMGFISDIHKNRCTSEITTESANMKIFIFMSKSEHGYSPKYPEHVFSVIGLRLCRHGLDHKLGQVTSCDDSVAICDCRNLWRLKMQFSDWCQLCQKVNW